MFFKLFLYILLQLFIPSKVQRFPWLLTFINILRYNWSWYFSSYFSQLITDVLLKCKPQIIATQIFKLTFDQLFSRTFPTIFFLQYILHFCEFKPFSNFIFQLPVWSKHQLQYIIPNSLTENIYIVFLTWLFDYLIYKVIFYFLYLFIFFNMFQM